MSPVHFAAPASEELAAAIRWYEDRRNGLGREFYEAVADAVELMAAHPDIGLRRNDGSSARQLLVARFPFNLVYRVRTDDLYVVAVAHTSRRPGYWRERP